MCGIAGIIATDGMSTKEVDLFQDLLRLNALRGEDSTGIFEITKEGSKKHPGGLRTAMIKLAEPSWWFIANKHVQNFLKYKARVGLIGHTRAATTGAVSDENAHPFDTENVIGVVNGTVSKYDIEGNSEFETDSEAMINLLSVKPKLEALSALTGLNRAPFALVFYDRRDHTINFLRSESYKDTRPLWAARSKDGKTMVFASEWPMISAVAIREGYELDQEYKFQSPPINQLYSYDLLEKDFLKHPKITTVVPKVRPTIRTSGQGGSGTYGGMSGMGVDWEEWARAADAEDQKRLPATTTPAPHTYAEEAKARALKGTGVDIGKEDPAHPWPVVGQHDPVPKHTKAVEALAQRREEARQRLEDAQTKLVMGLDKDDEDDEVRPVTMYNGPNNHLISEPVFKKYLSQGCAICTNIPELTDGLDMRIRWHKTDAGVVFMCENCKDSEWALDAGNKQ